MNPETAYKFVQVIESLTDPANVRPLVDEVYEDSPRHTYSESDRADLTARLVETFKELDELVKGSSDNKAPYFLDDPPTAIFVTAYRKAGLTDAMLLEHSSACDDGRLWIRAPALGEDARKTAHMSSEAEVKTQQTDAQEFLRGVLCSGGNPDCPSVPQKVLSTVANKLAHSAQLALSFVPKVTDYLSPEEKQQVEDLAAYSGVSQDFLDKSGVLTRFRGDPEQELYRFDAQKLVDIAKGLSQTTGKASRFIN